MTLNDPKGSLIRWQSTTITQLTYAINLILTFSVATLGFQVAMLQDKYFVPVSFQKCAFSLSLLLIVASIFLGILCVINRLCDFRETSAVAQMREKGIADTDFEINIRRHCYKQLGKRTWMYFWWQIGTFWTGMLFLIITIIANSGGKLL